MSKEYTEVKTRKVKYKCDKCDIGYYEHNGMCLTSYPEQYSHYCTNCGNTINLFEIYPKIEHYEELTK